MSFSTTYTFVVGDEPGLGRWLLEHYFEHMAMNQAAQGLGYNIPSYPIQSMGPNTQAWLDAHQQQHQALWTAVGGGLQVDLSLVDWEKDDDVYDWQLLHASVHAELRDPLGL